MQKTTLGIDIAKLKFDAALFRNGKFKTKVFKNNHKGFIALAEWLYKFEINDLHVCIEATGTYGEHLSYFLVEKEVAISVVNPAQIKGFSQGELTRTKTDKADAKLIARFCYAMDPPLWKPLPKEICELRSFVKRLESLQKMLQEEKNRLEVAHQAVKPSIEKIIHLLEVEVKEIRNRVKQHIDDHPQLKQQKALLETIPGVGDGTIAQILSMMCTPERFKNTKQLAAFAGLNPRHRQSGSSVKGLSHISKVGDGSLRKALYMPAVVAKQYNPVLKAFYEHLIKAGKHKMVALVAVMRKLLHIIFGVLKSGKPFEMKSA